MILVDTSIWVDHFMAGDRALTELLEVCPVLGHPWVAGELALGNLAQRREVLGLLAGLPQAHVASIDEVARFVETHRLYGLGIGYFDARCPAVEPRPTPRLGGAAAARPRWARFLGVTCIAGVGRRPRPSP